MVAVCFDHTLRSFKVLPTEKDKSLGRRLGLKAKLSQEALGP